MNEAKFEEFAAPPTALEIVDQIIYSLHHSETLTVPEYRFQLARMEAIRAEIVTLRQKVVDLKVVLQPLANLDLEGVNSATIYQRNHSFILTSDVVRAKAVMDAI